MQRLTGTVILIVTLGQHDKMLMSSSCFSTNVVGCQTVDSFNSLNMQDLEWAKKNKCLSLGTSFYYPGSLEGCILNGYGLILVK